MVFQTKKLAIETLSEYLHEVRTHLGLSIKEVSRTTGIGEKFLQQLESGDFHKLPPDVYIIGFLNKLSALYNISCEQVVAQYQKERGILEQVTKTEAENSKGLRAYFSRMIITPKLLSLVVGVTGVLAIVIYLSASVAAIDRDPTLTILEPTSGSVINDGSIKVSGKTDPGTAVLINDQEVFVDGEGKFNVTLGAVAGQKVLDIKATNKFDRQTSRQILVVVQPPQSLATDTGAAANPDPSASVPSGNNTASSGDTSGNNSGDLQLHLKYAKDTVRTIISDSGTPDQKTMKKNSTEEVSAKSSINLQTNDAGSVSAVLNGQNLGKLGRSGERLNIPFTKDSLLLSNSK